MAGNKTNRIQVMLDDETLDALKKAAKADKRTLSEYIRLLIEDHLNIS
ncbi:ribbon-helix-helix protein, CopG family [Nocardioides abyssi]|uniref:TraY domain-containing protein n=1 Tax=Nocardioides abyssi TaxID=3058370 RepID=A0ABT8EY25_9ACTN|nr:ribbon-helix-helix protein, CopG family [Nocardioides abyssi]MDN4162933.1 TraY domain-containing protein [Nocardioides abyssi]